MQLVVRLSEVVKKLGSRMRLLLVESVIAISLSSCISFGQVQVDSISSPGEVDTWYLSATAGDRLVVRMSRTSGGTDPQLSVLRPDSSQLCSGSTTESLLELYCPTDATGMHSIRASDLGGDETGNYCMYLQRSVNPEGAMDIFYGTSLAVNLSEPCRLNAYRFGGLPADLVLVT